MISFVQRGLEDGVGLEVERERADERDHFGMPETVEAKGAHFRESFIGGPVVERDPIGSDEHAGAVFAELTVDEELFRSIPAKVREKFSELSGSGGRKSSERNGDELNAEGLRLEALALARATRFLAKIDDGGDAEFFEFSEFRNIRLRAPIEVV